MPNSASKGIFLPSLIDRLIDDNSVKNSLKLQKGKLQELESELKKLQAEKDPADPDVSKKKRQLLQQEIDQTRAQYLLLSATIGSSLQDIRELIKRDLSRLLNTNQFAPQEELKDYPEIACSVLNYGMPDCTGKTISSLEPFRLERLLKQVLINFEPRIRENTLVVRMIADKSMHCHNALAFEIDGELWTKPQPIRLRLRTEFQLDDGKISVFDYDPDR